MNRKYTILSGFWLKIIALLTMTIDHVGWALAEFVSPNYFLVEPFRFIGRIALPLFCFMIVEGVIHTKNFGKYALRLGIMATAISIAIAFVEWSPFFDGFSIRGEGNIFLDLLLGALSVYLLRRKEIGFKLLAILPLGIGVASTIATCYEWSGNAIVHWYPFFLRTQYDFLSFAFIVIFYLAYIIKDLYFKIRTENEGVPSDLYVGTDIERVAINVISFVLFITIVLLFHFFSDVLMAKYYSTQVFAIFAGAFVLLYNGQRGYNSKYFQYGGYIYYPIHILVIALIFYLLYL